MDVLDATKAAVSHDMKPIPHILFFFFRSSSKVPFRLFQLTAPTSVPRLRLGSMTATLLLILLKQWRRCVGRVGHPLRVFPGLTPLSVYSVVAAAPDILSPLAQILESVLQVDQQMMDRTKAKIFSALISVLHIQGLNGTKCLSFVCV